MDAELATQLMHESAQSARDKAQSGDLSRFMRGYYAGKIDAYAVASGTSEVFDLARELSDEIHTLNGGAA